MSSLALNLLTALIIFYFFYLFFFLSGLPDFSNGNKNMKLLVYSRLIPLIVGLNLAREVWLLIQLFDQLHLNVAERLKET